MKKTLLYRFFMISSVLLVGACSKDIGNYEYHDINQITFTDFQTDKGYQAVFGDTLTINTTLSMSGDQQPKEEDYAYEWSLRLGSSTAPPLRDSVLSVNKVLKVKIGLAPGAYSLQYRVKDKKTGVQFQKKAALTVTTDVYEGYLVLNDVNGQSRLDMLSYKKATQTFEQYTDVLKKMGSTLPMEGKPYQVLCMQYTNANITPQNYGIFVLTSSGTNRINQETFGVAPNLNIRYLFVGDLPSNFAPQGITGELTFGIYPFLLLNDNGNVYSYSTFAGYAFKYAPLNVYTASGQPFNVSPYRLSNGTVTLMYNTEKKNFVTASSYTSTSVTDVPLSYNYPVGYDLVYMGKDYSNKAFAVLKDPATAKYWLMRFNVGAAQNYLLEVLGTDFKDATNFALSPEWGYLFYSVGGKVYEYDLALRTSKLMVDKGSSKVSYLAFQNFYIRFSNNNPNYRIWANHLTVGSYDPAGTPGSNGTLEQYAVPEVNGQIVKTRSWTGFGKIVSVAYRER